MIDSLMLFFIVLAFLVTLLLLWLDTRKPRRNEREAYKGKGYPGDMAVFVGCVFAIPIVLAMGG